MLSEGGRLFLTPVAVHLCLPCLLSALTSARASSPTSLCDGHPLHHDGFDRPLSDCAHSSGPSSLAPPQ